MNASPSARVRSRCTTQRANARSLPTLRSRASSGRNLSSLSSPRSVRPILGVKAKPSPPRTASTSCACTTPGGTLGLCFNISRSPESSRTRVDSHSLDKAATSSLLNVARVVRSRAPRRSCQSNESRQLYLTFYARLGGANARATKRSKFRRQPWPVSGIRQRLCVRCCDS